MALGVTQWVRGATSRSFGIFVVLVIGGILAIAANWGWRLFRPDPYLLSERIVRSTRGELGTMVRDFQRRVDTLLREARGSGKDPVPLLAEERAAVLSRIDEVVRDARARLAELDIAMRTEKNRLDRVERRAEETKQIIDATADDARRKLSGG